MLNRILLYLYSNFFVHNKIIFSVTPQHLHNFLPTRLSFSSLLVDAAVISRFIDEVVATHCVRQGKNMHLHTVCTHLALISYYFLWFTLCRFVRHQGCVFVFLSVSGKQERCIKAQIHSLPMSNTIMSHGNGWLCLVHNVPHFIS